MVHALSSVLSGREGKGPGLPGFYGEQSEHPWIYATIGIVRESSVDVTALGALVGEWLDLSEAGAVLGVSASRVAQLVKDHQLAAVVPQPRAGLKVPAAFFADGLIVKGVSGIITSLVDGGYDDAEILTWLFTDDDTLPGRPIDALRENRGSEAKRRAQAMAF